MREPATIPAEMADPSWSELYRRRREVNERFPSVFRLPRVRRAARLALDGLGAGARVLEVGSGGRDRGERLRRAAEGVVVVTVDPDPAAGADHAAVAEAGGPFDLALALEVIEHLPLAAGLDLLREIRGKLVPGGRLVVSTPNVFCPGRFLRDATHVTPYAFDELGGALLLSGFELVGLYRVAPGTLLRRTGKALVAPLGRALGVDHAPSVVAVARRPA